MNDTIIDLRKLPQWLFIGYATDNAARPQVFDFSSWVEEYGSGTLELNLQRPGDEVPYPVTLSIEGTTATWTPSSEDTKAKGQGMAQFVYTVGGTVAHTAILRVLIGGSLGAGEDAPNGFENWFQKMQVLAAAAADSADASAASADSAEESAETAAEILEDVGTAGTEQIQAIEAAGTEQITAVGEAGAAQVQAVEEKGEEVLESIPEDYSELSSDVVDLKSSLNKVAFFSPNLLDKENITRGKYLTSNNVEVTDANAFISNYFPCKPNEYFITKYSSYLGYGFITVYDSNKQYIASINGSQNGNYSVYQSGAATNIAFARICNQISFLDDLMIVSGNVYPDQYYAYGDKIRETTLPDRLWLDVTPDDIADAVFLNLFDKTTAIDGQYVESTTGGFSYNSTYWRSGYISVKPNTLYRASANNRVAFYDANKVYIEGYNNQYTYTSPVNAAYIVVCNTPLDSKNTFVLAENENYETVYHKYGIVIPWLLNESPKSKYASKNLVCFGDSITNYGYTNVIKEDTGINGINVGLSSGRYAYSDDSDQYVNAFAFYNICYSISTGDWTIPDSISGVSGYETQYAHIQDIKSIDFNTIDFASIAYGTNDFSSATPLDNENNPLDTNTFKGAIRYSLKLLTEKYPHLKIIGVTPCYRFWSENGTILYDSDDHSVGGFYLRQYVEAIEEVYTEYHLPVVNNYTNAGINKYNRLQHFSISDGLHPNENGRAIIGHRIGNGILANY